MTNEQQRIAEWLSAVDEEISAQGEAVAVRAKALPEYVEVLRTGATSRIYPTFMR